MGKPAIAIIQARMSSSRLPGKVLMPLAGKPIIWHIYDRASRCRLVDKVIVATSDQTSDDPLADFCHQNNMNVFRGSLDNVLSRYTDIISAENYPFFVRITGDCPLIHPQFIDNQIAALKLFDGDHTWCDNPGTAVEGQGVHSARSLFYIADHSIDPADLEHVGSLFLSNHPEQFRIVEIRLPKNLIVHNLRLTVDESDDYKMFAKLYDVLWPINNWIELKDAIQWLKDMPEIGGINQKIQHKLLNIELQNKRKKWRDLIKTGQWEFDDNI